MSFELTRLVLDETRSVPASADDFERGKEARANLLACIALEDTYNILIENFSEFEATLLNLALRDTLFTEGRWLERIDVLQLVNRRLANLLTTCRLYIDQAPQNLNDVFGQDSDATKRFVAATNQQYDSRLGYRAVEALRNYVQHRGLPVHELISRGAWSTQRSDRQHWIIPGLDMRQVRETGGFKASVLAELEALDQPVDIRPLLRAYLAGLSAIHGAIGIDTTSAASAATDVMGALAARYTANRESAELAGLAIVRRNQDGSIGESVGIFLDLGARWKHLVSRNSASLNPEVEIVTNKA